MKTNPNRTSNSTAAVGVIFHLVDGTIQSCNVEAENILGYTAEQLVGASPFDPPWQTIHEDGSPFPTESYPAIVSIRTSQPCSDVIMGFYKPNGDLVWISIDTLPLIKVNSNELYGVEVSFIDVTKDVGTEIISKTLDRIVEKQTFRVATKEQLVDVLPGVIYVYDAIAHRNVYVNSQAYDLLGYYTPQEISELEHNFVAQVMHPDDFTRFPAHISSLYNSEDEICKFEYRMRHKNGEWRWFCSQDRVYNRTADGSVEQIVGIARDITNRQQTEIALRESEARLKLATNASDIGMWFWDLIEDDLEFTPQCKILFGLPPEGEITYDIFLGVLHPEDRERTNNAVEEALANRTEYSIKYRAVWSDGSVYWILAKGRGFYNQSGEAVRMMGTVQDITAQKKLEQKLLQQTEDLTNANRLKDEFLAIVSHELRTPLNPILGWSQMLANGRLDAEKTAMGITIIERNAKLQAGLIEDLLDVSRILRGKLNLHKNPLDLESIIRSALTTTNLAAEDKSIQIKTNYESSTLQVLGDAGRLQQIVWNLVSNAIKFTPEDGQILIELERIDSYAQIKVRDTGKGIEPEFLPYVFERFRQAENSSTREYGGLGLGLAIVRHLTELHGGTVAVSSPGEGQGATFSVKLPLINIPTTEQTEIDSNFMDRSVQPNRFSEIKVLVVDDEPDSLDILIFLLQQEGAEVISVVSADEAIEALNYLTPDLIVSDIGMPKTNGFDLMKQIRQLPKGKNIPAIALTAYAREVDKQLSIDAACISQVDQQIK
ncbi:PAS domain-containing protein [Pleurocapsales cyanobacterium LEGE 10410]|nr:PAS domain-containing protein [Pleurocapsales cyanobacterium LEGE 10410]